MREILKMIRSANTNLFCFDFRSILKQGTSGEMIRRIDDTIQTDEGSALKKAKIDISTAATDILAVSLMY